MEQASPRNSEYLESLIPAPGATNDGPWTLDRMRQLLAELDNPHHSGAFVHVGGTAGKGSVATFLAAILGAAGYRTGLHVSPHFVELGERAQVAGANATPAELNALEETVRGVLERTRINASYFEASWAMALLHFRAAKTDVNVVEVGLGGRIDATNVISSRNQILTNIGLDHTPILGSTKLAILREKQEIVKPGSTVVSAIHEPRLRAVLEAHAAARSSRVSFAGRDFRCRNVRLRTSVGGLPTAVTFTFRRGALILRDLELPATGRGHAANAGLAIATALDMAEQWPAIDEHSIREGLRTAQPPGRVEITSTQPLTIFDGAHNPAKARWLARAVRDSFPEHRFVTVFRYRERPDIWKTLAAIAAISDEIVLTHCDLPGDMGVDPGYDAAAAARARRVFGATQIRDPRLAFAYAVERATTGSADGVLVTGSIPLVRQLYGTDVVRAATADPRAEGLDVAS